MADAKENENVQSTETNTNEPESTLLPPATDLVLTTIDNPYSPKTEYAKWKTWDNENGYDTEEFIARLITMEEDFDMEDELSIEWLTTKVIQEILDNDVLNVYILV